MRKCSFQFQRGWLLLTMVTFLGWTALCAEVRATTYYVDNAAKGADNGSSWSDAWTALDRIQWSTVRPGDTIFISGGSSSKTYSGRLVVEASGASGATVTITRSSEAGHSGTVIFDGKATTAILVEVDGRNHVTISGFSLRNTVPADSGRVVWVDESRGIAISDMTIQVSGRAGIFVQRSQECVVRNNRIETVAYVAQQSDGIYSQMNAGNIYENNWIVIRNSYSNGHNDGIQSYKDASLIIRGNYVEQDNPKTVNAQGIFCTTLSGTFQIYNNVVYAPKTYNSLIYLMIPAPSFHAVVLSNTLIGSKWGAIRVEGDDHAVIKNNIAWAYNGGVPLMYSGNTSQVTNNLLDRDPKLDASFVPLEGSPALDVGEKLPTPYNVDRLGNPRPRGVGFDIGAIEKNTGELPSQPNNLRIVM